MASGADTSGGGWPGAETRAVQAVHAQPVFRTSVMARAEAQSGRVADRWAPEGQGGARGAGMRTLGFADRVIGNYLGAGGVHAGRRAGAVDRPVAPMDWLFPVPWYLDELDWLAAGRAAARESERAAARSGQMARPLVSSSAEPRRAAELATTTTAAARFDLPLELVAPALAASRASEQRGRSAAPAVMRAYSPMVDPAAARAAEFLAQLFERNARSQTGSEAEALRPAPILEYVAPAELVASGSERASRAQVAWAAQQTLEAARQAEAIAEARARAAAIEARAQPASVRADDAGRHRTGDAAPVEVLRAEQAARADRQEQAEEAARFEAARAEAVRGEAGRADEVRAELTRVESMRAEAARSEAVRAHASARGEQVRLRAAAPAASPSQRALELLAASALGDGERMALSAGPRVLMPAGLGGLVAATHQSRAVSRPVARPAGLARSFDAPIAGGGSAFASAPAALEHLVWSDRWLARFAGASATTLRSFDIARPLPAIRAGAAPDWQPAWVSAADDERRTASGRISGRRVPSRVFTAPATAPIVDDDQPVGEDVLAAIAAAAASDRRERQRPPRPRPAGPAEPTGPFRAPAADRALARFAMPSSAGLRATLGASPVAALVAGLVEGGTQTAAGVFDARPLFAASVSDFLARGASRAAALVPYQRLPQQAPGATWLAMPSAPTGFGPFARTSFAAEMARAPLRSVGGRQDRGAAPPAARPLPTLSLVAPGSVAQGDSAARAAARSAFASLPGAALSSRPGSLAVGAERFAGARAAAAADLALDFLAPEVLVAARSFGFTPAEAVRAQRLAASGKGEMSRLASLVDQVFVSALSPAGRAARFAAGTATATASGALDVDRLSVAELTTLGAQRAPRGAFLMPPASSRALGISANQAESTQPGIQIALELVAAGQVAEVATQRSAAAAVQPPTGRLAADPGGPHSAALPEDARARGAAMRETAQERAATEAARAMLPRALWSVFDAVYLSLGEETVASDVRPLGPAARAARALALAGRARGPEDLPISARARAAAAWAVLPVVLTGGGAPSALGARSASARAAGRAPATPSTYVSGDPAETSAASGRPAASRAGEALASLVAPAFFRADDRGDGYGPFVSPRAVPATTFVDTGSVERPAPPRPAPPPPPPRPAPAPRAAEPTQKEFEAWFQSAAKKYFGEAPSQSGLTAAEMTLVTSAPRTQIAASTLEAARPVLQAQSAAPGPASGPGASQEGRGQQPNIDKIAQDVYEEIVRMLAIARERSGDPWNR